MYSLALRGKILKRLLINPQFFFHGVHVLVEHLVFLVGHLRPVGLLQQGELLVKFQCHSPIPPNLKDLPDHRQAESRLTRL